MNLEMNMHAFVNHTTLDPHNHKKQWPISTGAKTLAKRNKWARLGPWTAPKQSSRCDIIIEPLERVTTWHFVSLVITASPGIVATGGC